MKPLYLLISLLLLVTAVTQGEGTKEVMPVKANGTGLIVSTTPGFPLGNVGSYLPGLPGSTLLTPKDQRIYFRIKDFNTETLYYGFNWETLSPSKPISTYNDVYMNIYDPNDNLVATVHLPGGTAPGFIANWSPQAILGPKIAGVGAGYDPLTFTPTKNGDYWVNFYRSDNGGTNHSVGGVDGESMLAKYFDMTVVGINGAKVTMNTGRVHCAEWAFSVYNASPGAGDIQDPLSSTNAQFHTYTPDSVNVKVYFPASGFQPLSYIVAFNSFGVIDGGNWLVDRKSVVLPKLDTLHLRGGYAVFLNPPDTSLYVPAPMPQFPQLVNPTISGCAPGPFNIRFKAPQAGDYYMLLDLNGVAGYQANSADLFIELINQAPGIITYVWNGKNGLGVQVPANTTFPITFSFRKGRINIPFYDVEMNINGFTVEGPPVKKIVKRTLYWDDSGITQNTNDPTTNNRNFTIGGIDNSIVGQFSPGHAWNGDGNPNMTIPAPAQGGNNTDNDQTNDYGNARLINTWAWGYVLDTTQNITLTCVSVKGAIYDDADNSANGGFSNIRTNAEDTVNPGNTMYASLIDPVTGLVMSTAPLVGKGTYTLTNCPANATGMMVVISTSAGVVGAVAPTGNIPGAWINTTPLIRTFNTGTGDVSGIDFGVEQLPNSNDQWYTISTPVLNSSLFLNGSGTGSGSSPGRLFGSDPEDGALNTGKKVIITQVPTNEELYYNGVLVTNNTTITNYNPALLKVKFISITQTTLSFKYAFFDAADKQDPTPATYRIDMSAVLATTLSSFTGRSTDEGNVLNWTALNETNGVFYIIERSDNGGNFTPIGQLTSTTATGNGSSANHIFVDPHPLTDGPNYYRLQLSDNTGGATYSNIVILTSVPSSSILELAPNPFRDAINIRLNLVKAEKIELRLFDSKGSLLKRAAYQGAKGSNTLNLGDLQSLPVSVYFIQVVLSDQTFVRKVFNR